MKARTKPTEWKLQNKTNEELLRLAVNKLKQRTIREGEKMDKNHEAGVRDEKQRSKFYAIWYAFEALRIYCERNGLTIHEPFPKPEPEKTIEQKIEDIFDDFGHEVVNRSEASRAEMNARYRRILIATIRNKK